MIGVYKVRVETYDSGMVIIQSGCNKTTPMHVQNCSPCHQPIIHTIVDPLLQYVRDDASYSHCHSSYGERIILACKCLQ